MYKFDEDNTTSFKPFNPKKMPEKITQELAQMFTEHYRKTFEEKGVEHDGYIRSYFINREAIESIFRNAEENGIYCAGIRVFFGKKTSPSEEDIAHEIFYTHGNYNMVVAGVDDDQRTIIENDEIYDNFDPCPQLCPTNPNFCP